MSTSKRRTPLQTVLAVIVVAGVWFAKEKGWIAASDPQPDGPAPATAPSTESATSRSGKCVSVIDGDTLDVVLDGTKQRIRVLGIDCAETYNKDKAAGQARSWNQSPAQVLRLGNAAKAFAQKQCNQQTVQVVADNFSRDEYGRLLAYVEVDGIDLGADLLSQGLAEARREPHARKAHYHQLERAARQDRLGLWSNTGK